MELPSFVFLLQNRFHRGVQPVAVEVLDVALVHQLGQRRIDGHFRQQRPAASSVLPSPNR